MDAVKAEKASDKAAAKAQKKPDSGATSALPDKLHACPVQFAARAAASVPRRMDMVHCIESWPYVHAQESRALAIIEQEFAPYKSKMPERVFQDFMEDMHARVVGAIPGKEYVVLHEQRDHDPHRVMHRVLTPLLAAGKADADALVGRFSKPRAPRPRKGPLAAQQAALSEYEQNRLVNIARNKEQLRALGLQTEP